MVPVLVRNGGVDVGVHEAIRWISGHGHQAPKVCNKHAEGTCLKGTAIGFSLFLGLLQIFLDELDEPGNALWLIKLAAGVIELILIS